ncbi:hypothetical protein [Croceicoccus bisphenolivorans]|uniref:hypothetical protein n=1 Tax=Croceicoccus bisphenolivorans TaxID=1783232 RepID=UPI000830EE92|nr:hypothetical protein [Croceicoccus bisphenolivorans]
MKPVQGWSIDLGLGIGALWLLPLALTGASADVHAIRPVTQTSVVADSTETTFSEIRMQVETRRRVMIRITPLSRVAPPPPVVVQKAEPRRRATSGEAQQCIPLEDVAGVKLGQGRTLLLYMRDRRVVRTLLERSCQVSSFYSGFYVERPADGMLCAGREALHARSGADCQLSAFSEVGDEDGE